MATSFDKRIQKTQCPEFLQWLMKRISVRQTVLDIGCGQKWYYPFLSCKSITSIDSWEKAKPDYVMDLNIHELSIFFERKSFDVVLMLDFIEHVEKELGLTLLEEASSIARKKIILLTPLYWDENINENGKNSLHGNPHRAHRSLWTERDFRDWKRFRLPCFNEMGKECFLGELNV